MHLIEKNQIICTYIIKYTHYKKLVKWNREQNGELMFGKKLDFMKTIAPLICKFDKRTKHSLIRKHYDAFKFNPSI